MDAETAARLGAALSAAMRTITPTQRHIAELLGRGYSQRQIAEKTGRKAATVNQNIANIRAKIAAYIRDNAPEFADMIDGAAVDTAATAAADHNRTADGRRTANGAARHSAQMKATQAERARRYRERKAAERMAAQNGNK